MTPKDYSLIANALANSKPPDGATFSLDQWKRTVEKMSLALATANANFDARRFEQTCGYDPM